MKDMGFTHESTHNETMEWYTPPAVFDALGLCFDMDVASPGKAIVPWIPAAEHLTLRENGLVHPWDGRVWLNPPYGSLPLKWVAKFSRWSDGVMLVFARPDTAWFHDFAVECSAVLFMRGRIRFIGADVYCGQGCGAASMLLAQGEDCVRALRASGLGFFIDLRLNRIGS